MITRKNILRLLPLLALLDGAGSVSTAGAQGTAFTYQGRLASGGLPANGSYDVLFTLYDTTNSAGRIIAGPVTNAAVAVSSGLFIATVDFGAGVFTGTNYWLDIAVRTNGGGAFTELAPRQQLLPVPYAITANSASNLLGVLNASQLTGTIQTSSLPANPTFSGRVTAGGFAGDGSGLTNLNASLLTTGTVSLAQLPPFVITNNESGVTLNVIPTASQAPGSALLDIGQLVMQTSTIQRGTTNGLLLSLTPGTIGVVTDIDVIVGGHMWYYRTNLFLRIATDGNLNFNVPMYAILCDLYRQDLWTNVDFQFCFDTPGMTVCDYGPGLYQIDLRLPTLFTNGCTVEIWDTNTSAVFTNTGPGAQLFSSVSYATLPDFASLATAAGPYANYRLKSTWTNSVVASGPFGSPLNFGWSQRPGFLEAVIADIGCGTPALTTFEGTFVFSMDGGTHTWQSHGSDDFFFGPFELEYLTIQNNFPQLQRLWGIPTLSHSSGWNGTGFLDAYRWWEKNNPSWTSNMTMYMGNGGVNNLYFGAVAIFYGPAE